MATKEVTIKIKLLDDESDLLGRIQLESDSDVQGLSNVTQATFILQEDEDYEFSVEVMGTPGKKFEVLVEGAESTSYRRGEVELPENGRDVIVGDLIV